MTAEPELYAALTEILRDVLMDDSVVASPELTAKDVPGWDSFKQIEIIMAVEERFGIKLNTRELDSLRNVGDLAAIVASRSG